MTPFLQDADCTLWHGDALDVLAGLPADSVDCVVTSPPYWGLRDYGTGAWEGGDEGCDHTTARSRGDDIRDGDKQGTSAGSRPNTQHECSCGARRVDNQLGLEPTPDQYVQRIVDVFREVRRVLCAHGTVWCNLGDSYASAWACDRRNVVGAGSLEHGKREDRPNRLVGGLKEKDLVGIPWRVAFALQADGWWLRSDIVWAKPNPMPESVTDRPTKAHEYVFLLTKASRYFFDQEAVREDAAWARWGDQTVGPGSNPNGWIQPRKKESLTWDERKDAGEPLRQGLDGKRVTVTSVAERNQGRNIRSVWTIATQPYPEAHFATYPEELVRRCVLAGCPERVCRTCGKAAERLTDVSYEDAGRNNNSLKRKGGGDAEAAMSARPYETRKLKHTETLGWSDCGHNDWRPGLVLDPFLGSGTTCLVARNHGRHSIGIDLSADYLALAATRLQQLSLLTGEAHASQ